MNNRLNVEHIHQVLGDRVVVVVIWVVTVIVTYIAGARLKRQKYVKSNSTSMIR